MNTETQSPHPVGSSAWWEIPHPGTQEKVKCATFNEAMEKWFEGFNIPVLVVDGVREDFSKAFDRVKRYYAAPNVPALAQSGVEKTSTKESNS